MPTIHTILEKEQASWGGHGLPMNDQRIPNVLLYGKLADGNCKVGRPRFRFKDSCKTILKSSETPLEALEALALN